MCPGLGNTYLHRACSLHGLQDGHMKTCLAQEYAGTFCSNKGGFAKMSSNLTYA